MIVNFKGEYKFQESLLTLLYSSCVFFNEFIQHKEWTLSMDNVNGAHGFRGHRIVCLDIVQDINGQCPHFPLRESPWIKSRESMDILQGDGGPYPMSPWKLASLSGLPGLCLEYPWTLSRLSTKSMDIVQGDNGECLLSQ